jgi:hypothetical protein
LELVPDALATAPSRASGTPVRASSSSANRKWPEPIATAVHPAMTIPTTVTTSAVMPVRRRPLPMGLRPSSMVLRQRPSNMFSISWVR